MRRLVALALPIALAAASAPVLPSAETADSALVRARTEAQQAAKRLRELEAKAALAGSEAERLRAEQATAAAAIEETEARIGEANARLRLAAARASLAEQRLRTRQAPLAALLAGLSTMGRQPPILALADGGSIDQMVRVKALLDATMPVIERRSASLMIELNQRKKLAAETAAARSALTVRRAELNDNRARFAKLEAQAAARSDQLEIEAFAAGDRVLAGNEALSLAASEATEQSSARLAAIRLSELEFARARPFRGDSALAPQDFGYSLPADAPPSEGFGTVSRTGIVARGLKLRTTRNSSVIVPADGKVAFAGPYRGQDGVVIIQHSRGWMSLLLGVASSRPEGTRVARGEVLGRALGPLGVELRRNGYPVSPALIAASSVPLSNGGKTR